MDKTQFEEIIRAKAAEIERLKHELTHMTPDKWRLLSGGMDPISKRAEAAEQMVIDCGSIACSTLGQIDSSSHTHIEWVRLLADKFVAAEAALAGAKAKALDAAVEKIHAVGVDWEKDGDICKTNAAEYLAALIEEMASEHERGG